jgi:hypothetical protein
MINQIVGKITSTGNLVKIKERDLRDLDLRWTRVNAEPSAIQIDAYIGDLYLGQRTYYGTSMKVAMQRATRYIELHGSLH